MVKWLNGLLFTIVIIFVSNKLKNIVRIPYQNVWANLRNVTFYFSFFL